MHEKSYNSGASSKLSMILVTVVAVGVIGFIIWQIQSMGEPPGSDYQKLESLEPAEAEAPAVDPEVARSQQDIEAMVARIDAKMKARKNGEAPDTAEVAISDPLEPAFAEADPAKLDPVEQVEATRSAPGPKADLPSLAESDGAIKQDLANITPEAAELLVDEFVIAKSARAIAALSEGKLVNEFRPLKNPLTPFAAEPLNQGYQISSVNAVRYKIYLDVLTNIGTERLVKMYWHYYPLLEEAYRELGVSEQEFKDVTIAAIDQLLGAPQLSPNHVLVHPTVMYKYEDPALENLPPAHKLMMRLGASNRARLEPLLRNIRDELNKS